MQIKLEMFESTVNGISKFYTYSHKRRRELACLGELFNEPDNENGFKLRHFVDMKNGLVVRNMHYQLSDATGKLHLIIWTIHPMVLVVRKLTMLNVSTRTLNFVIWLHFMNYFLAALATLSNGISVKQVAYISGTIKDRCNPFSLDSFQI